MLSRTFLRPALAVAVGSALALGLTAAPAAAAPAVASVVVTAKVTATRITAQPKAASVVVGRTATFAVKAKGTKRTYQWYVRKPGTSRYVAVKGAKAPTYRVKTSARLDGARYRVVVKGSKGKVTSRSALLTVISKPKITTQPRTTLVTSGQVASFSVKATGHQVRYQWQTRSAASLTWVALAGKTGTTLTVKARTANDGDEFRAVASTKAGSVPSAAAVLWVDSTRTDPYAVGAPVILYDWAVALDVTDLDGTDQVLAGNPSNAVPPAGWTYVTAPVLVCYLSGADTMDPALTLELRLLGSDGVSYDAGGASLGDGIQTVGNLGAASGTDGCGSFTAAALVPAAAAPGGRWLVTDTSGPTVYSQYVALR